MSVALMGESGTDADVLQRMEYERIARELWFKVSEKAQDVVLFNSLGTTITSPTVSVFTPLAGIYNGLGEFASGFGSASPLNTGITYTLSKMAVFCSKAHGNNVESQFDRLAEEWERATRHLSRLSAKSLHPAYRKIIDLGESAVPFILRKLEKVGGYWSPALKEITGVDPVSGRQTCSIREEALAWIEWGRAHGKVP
jgi:hypothetical protein